MYLYKAITKGKTLPLEQYSFLFHLAAFQINDKGRLNGLFLPTFFQGKPAVPRHMTLLRWRDAGGFLYPQTRKGFDLFM
jgi:hypothetical protein